MAWTFANGLPQESPSTLALQGGTDPSGRPMFPSLYVTDITNNLNSTAGDWQQGGTPIAPSAVYGTWKSITETIDETKKRLKYTKEQIEAGKPHVAHDACKGKKCKLCRNSGFMPRWAAQEETGQGDGK